MFRKSVIIDKEAVRLGSVSASWKVLVFAALVVALLGLLYGYVESRKELEYFKTSEGQAEAVRLANEKIIADVGQLIALPEGEKPLLFDITNAEQLIGQQDFFKGSQDGDKLIVYSTRAIIYSPGRNILVNVGPVTFAPSDGVTEIDAASDNLQEVDTTPSPTPQPVLPEDNGGGDTESF